MNNILWCLIALIFNPFTMGVTLYMNGLIWISLDFTARPVMNLNNWSMVAVGLIQVGYVSLVMKNYKRNILRAIREDLKMSLCNACGGVLMGGVQRCSDFEIYNLSDLTKEELYESVKKLKQMIKGEIEWREECAKRKADKIK